MIKLPLDIKRVFVYSSYDDFIVATKQETYYYIKVKRQIR